VAGKSYRSDLQDVVSPLVAVHFFCSASCVEHSSSISTTATYRLRSWHQRGFRKRQYRSPWARRSGRRKHRLERHCPPLGTSPSCLAKSPSSGAAQDAQRLSTAQRQSTHVTNEQLSVVSRIMSRPSAESTTESTASCKRSSPEGRFAHGRTDLTGNRRRTEAGLGFSVL
jgi:hypothetical protein